MLSTKHCPPRTAAHPLLCRARLLHPARRLASSHACPTPCRRTSLRGLLGAVHGRCYHATHAVARRAPANDAASLRGRRGRLRHHATGEGRRGVGFEFQFRVKSIAKEEEASPPSHRLRVSISNQVQRPQRATSRGLPQLPRRDAKRCECIQPQVLLSEDAEIENQFQNGRLSFESPSISGF